MIFWVVRVEVVVVIAEICGNIIEIIDNYD